MNEAEKTKKLLNDIIDGGTTEVVQVSDGNVIFFTETHLKLLLAHAQANPQKKAVVFIKHSGEAN